MTKTYVFEEGVYVDRGCDISKTCLACPLPACRYDDIKFYRNYKRELHREALMADIEAGKLTIQALAEKHGTVERTVSRQKSQMQKAGIKAMKSATQERISALRGDIESGNASMTEIAGRHGLSRRTVNRYRLEIEKEKITNGTNVKRTK